MFVRGLRPLPASSRTTCRMRFSPSTRRAADRLAQRPAAVRRRGGDFAAQRMQVPATPQTRREMAALFVHRRAALDLSDARAEPLGVGAQHPAGRDAALFDYVP